jgi:D-alanyl-D-alanine carboxypeptidase
MTTAASLEASPTTPPTAEALPTTPIPTLQPPVPTTEIPCGVILPILSNSQVPAGAESEAQFEEIEIPDSVPEAARPALQRLLDSPEAVGLAAYRIGWEGVGLYHNADVPAPLASVVKILDLIAYAEAANAGRFNPATWIPLAEMERYYLPGTDLGAHRDALADLDERNLVAFESPATPLEEIPWLMMRFSSNAATDYLHMAVGQEVIEETAVALGLSSQTAPCPFIGQFLAMSNHSRSGSDYQVIEEFVADPAAYGQEVIRLTHLFAEDETFRKDELNLRDRQPSFPVQTYFVENLNAQASPNDYANLMARIMQNGLSAPYVNILVRRNLEWPMVFPANQELFTTVGYKNGSMPGVLTTVYYAQRLEDGANIVVALFYRDLPQYLYQQWRRSLAHDEFARWILSDPQAIPILKALLE